MNDVAEVDLTTLWACAPAQALQRTVDICLSVLKGRGAFVGAFCDSEGLIIRATSGAVDHAIAGVADEGGAGVVTAPICVGGRRVGTLGVVAGVEHDWSAEDRGLLRGFADCLAGHLELNAEVARRNAGDAAAHATTASFLSVSENIPALVFERRKIDAGRSSYRFFGHGKSDLPAVRELTERGEASPLNFVFRDDRDAVRAALLRSNLEETDLDMTFRIKDFGRRVRWVRSQSIVRRQSDGDVVWDGFCFDVSDLMAARDTAADHRPTSVPSPGDAICEPLLAIVETCERLKTEVQPAMIAAHAGAIQATARAMIALLDPRVDAYGEVARSVPTPEPENPPRAVPPMAPVDVPATCATAPSGARILVADDLDLNRKLIADMLGLDGHVVDSVADGAAALAAVKSRRYDLVLMDMVMPGMDGLVATQAIRALPGAAADIPIIGLTAHSQAEELDRCRASGMDAVLTKPMSMDALSAVVIEWTRNRKAA